MNKYEQIKGMANPNRGSVGVQEARPKQETDWKDEVMEQQEETILWQAKRIAELIDTPPQRTEQEPLNQLVALKEMLQKQVDRLIASNPQRTWVGLTEQQRNDIEDACEMIIGKPAFDATEAKLKELNT